MRLEQLVARALDKIGNDKYLLAVAVSKRATQLNKGAKPLIDIDVKKFKYTDIAIMEIAEGKLKIDSVIDN
ncbi:MAG: DNA-directed RNA polymerase subunit omega [Campylobacterales bacterium]|nr:DNA-directed RNA polymerase subunit omega [Campylobacterales bacterium]